MISEDIRATTVSLYQYSLVILPVGTSQPDFDSQTLAILRGRLVRYLMRSKEVGVLQ